MKDYFGKVFKSSNFKKFFPLFIIGLALPIAVFAALQQQNLRNFASSEVVCPQDVKTCPDGSYVSRVGPKCEFAACPAAVDKSIKTLQLTSIADSYVRSNQSTRNFGSSNVMWMDGKPQVIAYLKFDLSKLSGREITNAKLRLKVANIKDSASTGIFNIHPVFDNSWAEKKINFKNKPSIQPAISSFSNPKKQQSIEIDLTSVIKTGGGIMSIAIDTTSSDGAVIRSKEATSASNRPTLIIEYK